MVLYVLLQPYITPPFSVDSLKKLAQFMAVHPDVPVMVLGDFNNTLDPHLVPSPPLVKPFLPPYSPSWDFMMCGGRGTLLLGVILSTHT